MIPAVLPPTKAAASRVIILSPLAEGADRLYSNILENPHSRLEAVLPLVVKDYLEDFATQASRDEFQTLLDRADRVIVLRHELLRVGHSEVEQAELRLDVPRRRDLHRRSLRRTARRVDGAPARGRGGTARLCSYARDMQCPVICIWDGLVELLGNT